MIKKPFVVAEIGCNHSGSLTTAFDMIQIAATYCKCDYVKFQKRNLKELLTLEEYNTPHPDQNNAFGSTYGSHREVLEFNLEQHKELKECCERFGVKYVCSVWDLTSAKEIMSLNPDYIKIPSALNQNFELLRLICNEFPNDIHVSLGMTTEQELKSILELFYQHNRHHSLVLYSCTSSYPCRFEDVCLLEITKLNELLKSSDGFKGVGLSGHHLGIAVDIAAIILGVSYIERHFTSDRSQKGSDHSASLEPDQIRKLVRDRNNLFKALTYKQKGILDCELSSRKKLKRINLI